MNFHHRAHLYIICTCCISRMRSGQEPVKIECFELKDNGSRDKIGHILLSLRTARIILPRDECVDVAANWHTFFNLRSDLKAHKPAILLSLTIEEHEAYERRILSKEVTLFLQHSLAKLPSVVEKQILIYLLIISRPWQTSWQCLTSWRRSV